MTKYKICIKTHSGNDIACFGSGGRTLHTKQCSSLRRWFIEVLKFRRNWSRVWYLFERTEWIERIKKQPQNQKWSAKIHRIDSQDELDNKSQTNRTRTKNNAQNLLVLEKYDEKDQLHYLVSLTLFSRNYSNKNIALSQFGNLISNVNIIQNYWERAIFRECNAILLIQTNNRIEM